MSARAATIIENFADPLTRISVDQYHFCATRHALRRGACILWLQIGGGDEQFEALGQFFQFDRRAVLEFIARYVSSGDLRREVEKKRFEARINTLPCQYFSEFIAMTPLQKEEAFRSLFNLDSMLEQPPLAAKRRMIARRFHPDAGGDTASMTIINEAYEFLAARR